MKPEQLLIHYAKSVCPDIHDMTNRQSKLFRVALYQVLFEKYGMVWHEVAAKVWKILGLPIPPYKDIIYKYRKRHYQLLRLRHEQYQFIYEQFNKQAQ